MPVRERVAESAAAESGGGVRSRQRKFCYGKREVRSWRARKCWQLSFRRCADAPCGAVARRAPRMQTFEAQLAFDPAQLAVFTVALSARCILVVHRTRARLNLAKDKRLEGGDTNSTSRSCATVRRAAARALVFRQVAEELRPSKAPRPAPEGARRTRRPAPAPAPTLGELFAPASLAGNATPKFFSGDNPIVVTVGALLALGTPAAGASRRRRRRGGRRCRRRRDAGLWDVKAHAKVVVT